MIHDDVKMVCGHRVSTEITKGSDTAWCPICKRELFTGWPEHMERKAALAQRMKTSACEYLDDCATAGVEPRLAGIVSACESHITASAFSVGRQSGSAIDAD